MSIYEKILDKISDKIEEFYLKNGKPPKSIILSERVVILLDTYADDQWPCKNSLPKPKRDMPKVYSVMGIPIKIAGKSGL